METIVNQSKMFYLARDYQDRHYQDDLKIAVVNTTRDVFQGSNKILSPYLDPIQHRRLENGDLDNHALDKTFYFDSLSSPSLGF